MKFLWGFLTGAFSVSAIIVGILFWLDKKEVSKSIAESIDDWEDK